MSTLTSPMSIKLPVQSRENLRTIAIMKKRPAHALVREAIEVYISEELERQRLNQEAEASWQHYQETGLHATGEAVLAWIDSWGTSNELPIPKCHI